MTIVRSNRKVKEEYSKIKGLKLISEGYPIKSISVIPRI